MGDMFDLESEEYGYVLIRYRFDEIDEDGGLETLEVQSNIDPEVAVVLAESFLDEYAE